MYCWRDHSYLPTFLRLQEGKNWLCMLIAHNVYSFKDLPFLTFHSKAIDVFCVASHTTIKRNTPWISKCEQVLWDDCASCTRFSMLCKSHWQTLTFGAKQYTLSWYDSVFLSVSVLSLVATVWHHSSYEIYKQTSWNLLHKAKSTANLYMSSLFCIVRTHLWPD